MGSAILIYKSRLYTKRNDINCTVKNAAHISYIANRPGAWKDEQTNTALFGSFNQVYLDSICVDEGIKKIERITDDYKTVYRDIISFSSAQAKHLGLTTLADWKKYVKEQVLVIAKERGIKYENLEWEAAIHNKEGQPHAHLVLWDKSPAIQQNCSDWKLNKKIREKLIQKTYKEEFQEFFKQQNTSKNLLRSSSRDMFSEFIDYISTKEKKNQLSLYDISEFSSTNILCLNVNEAVYKFKQIKLMLNEYTGSHKYQYLPKEIKSEMNSYIKFLIDNNPDLRKLVDDYVNSHMQIYKFYSAKDKEINYQRNKYSGQAIKMLCNSLLSSMDNYSDDLSVNSDTAEEYVAFSIFSAFSNLSHLLRQQNAKNNSIMINKIKSSDLSKEAIKEIIKKEKDRGLEM